MSGPSWHPYTIKALIKLRLALSRERSFFWGQPLEHPLLSTKLCILHAWHAWWDSASVTPAHYPNIRLMTPVPFIIKPLNLVIQPSTVLFNGQGMYVMMPQLTCLITPILLQTAPSLQQRKTCKHILTTFLNDYRPRNRLSFKSCALALRRRRIKTEGNSYRDIYCKRKPI